MTGKKTVAVIGGYGGMGRFFAELFAGEGFKVVVTGPNEFKGEKAARELNVSYERDNKKAAEKADIVMISVPIDETLKVIREVAPAVRGNSLLMDVTSVKEEPCKAMEKYSKKEVEVVGSHPVFSHRVGGIEGQVFILTPVRGVKWLNWLRKFLREHKARVYESTPREHDEIMAVVQGLTHFTYISIGKTLEELDFDIKKSREFSSPIYELMLDMVGRIIGQNPELYSSIQMQNPRIVGIHRTFLETAEELSKTVAGRDERKFKEIMISAARYFDDVDRAMGRSDKAIASLVSELSHLKNSIGKELCLKHIYSGRVHLGFVKSVTPEEVVLEESGKKHTLKLSNIRVLEDEERTEFKKGKYGVVKRDFSIILDRKVDERFLSRLLEDFDEMILKVETKDVYSGPQIDADKKSVCFSVTLINSGVKETEEKINKFFADVGGSLR
jgi:prephenate dehydrogenase